MEIDHSQDQEQDDTSSSSCCWLCLGGGSDASGMPLVRNCSCRGSSGFAHLSCIICYAEIDGRNSYRSTGNIGTAFQECPNCRQEFQNDLRYHLERARVLFVEREFSQDHMLHLHVLLHSNTTADIVTVTMVDTFFLSRFVIFLVNFETFSQHEKLIADYEKLCCSSGFLGYPRLSSAILGDSTAPSAFLGVSSASLG